MSPFKILQRMSTYQIVALTFLILISVGTGLLMLPMASAGVNSLSFVDALFTSTSAVCVTGLVVVDTGTYFSVFGQMIILMLIQIGGLGVMTFASLVSIAIGKKINLRERLLLQEALNQEKVSGVVRLTLKVVKYTFFIEFLFGSVLAYHLYGLYGEKGIYFGYWHAVSAFCNAGFDLFGNFDSLTAFVGDGVINFCVMSLIILGGMGFVVMDNIFRARRFRDLTLQSKIVTISTIGLIFFGTVLIWLLEEKNPATIASLTTGDQWLASMFQAVTPRTAGFNTLPLERMTEGSLFLTIILMIIGASPASTGGGLKTTTFAVVVLAAWAMLHGRSEIVIFGRRIAKKSVNKAFSIVVLAILLVSVITLGISVIEDLPIIHVLYEVASAFGTVGLSVGITRDLSEISKLLLVFTMFAGRVGVLTFAMLLLHKPKTDKIKYPEEQIIIG